MEEQVSMTERMPAALGGDMEQISMRETIKTPKGIETLTEELDSMNRGMREVGPNQITDTMKMAGGGTRGWKAQMLAEDLAQEQYGKDFYDLSQDLQFEIFTLALDMIDSGGD